MFSQSKLPSEKAAVKYPMELSREDLPALLDAVLCTPMEIFDRFGSKGSSMILKALCEAIPERATELKASKFARMVLTYSQMFVDGTIVLK